MIFYERFFNWEVAAGGYLMRNNAFSRSFLQNWANQWNITKMGKVSTNDNLLIGERLMDVVYRDKLDDPVVRHCLGL